jgi:hypothetical protein
MPFDPGRDGWRLDEAVMRQSDPEALAELARLCSTLARRERWERQPRWWVEALAPEVAGHEPAADDRNKRIGELTHAIARTFLDRLAAGELTAWARRDSPMAAYERVPADAWPVLRGRTSRWDWRESGIWVMEGTRVRGSSTQLVREQHLQPDSRGNLTVRTVSRTVPKPVPEPKVVLRLYSVRVQPPGRRDGGSASEARCREWLAGLMRAQPDAPRPKVELGEEARQTFGLGQRAFARAWRGALAEAGPAWSRAGPRKSGR